MKAGVLYAPHDLRVEDRPMPTFGDDDVLIQVVYNGLCGTDVSEYSKGAMMVPLSAPHPGSGHVGPTTLGHEFIGQIVDAGSASRGRIGQLVACGAGISCGSCRWCRAGRTNLCERYYTLGLSTHGGLAEFVAAPASICVPVPEGCSERSAALAQPLAVGIHAVRRASVMPGDAVVVLGAGAIGSFILSALNGHDGEVIALDIDDSRLDVARRLGATQTVRIDPGDGPQQMRDLLPAGAQVVFETSGVPGGAERALALCARGGVVELVGLSRAPQSLVLADIVLREIDIHTTVAHVCGSDIPESLELLSRFPLADLYPLKVIGLDDVVSEGLDPLSSGQLAAKVLVDPRG